MGKENLIFIALCSVTILLGCDDPQPEAHRTVVPKQSLDPIYKGLPNSDDIPLENKTDFFLVGEIFIPYQRSFVASKIADLAKNPACNAQSVIDALVKEFDGVSGAYRTTKLPVNSQSSIRLDFVARGQQCQIQICLTRAGDTRLPTAKVVFLPVERKAGSFGFWGGYGPGAPMAVNKQLAFNVQEVSEGCEVSLLEVVKSRQLIEASPWRAVRFSLKDYNGDRQANTLNHYGPPEFSTLLLNRDSWGVGVLDETAKPGKPIDPLVGKIVDKGDSLQVTFPGRAFTAPKSSSGEPILLAKDHIGTTSTFFVMVPPSITTAQTTIKSD